MFVGHYSKTQPVFGQNGILELLSLLIFVVLFEK